jgi:hypothetical protein
MAISIRESAIRAALNKPLTLLRQTYRSVPNEELFGWYHYLDDPKPGVTASAVALYCFDLAGDRFERTEEVLLYLKNTQIASSDIRNNGGWPVRTTLTFPIIESTAWVVRSLALNKTLFGERAPGIQAGYEWIVNNQNMDYGWASCHGQPSRTFHTALALLAITSFNRYSKEASMGADWLLKHQKRDIPGWGATPDSKPTILHTCFALLALSEIPNKINRQIIHDSLEWVESVLDTKSLTELYSLSEDYDIPFVDNGNQMIYQNSLPHFCLPIAVYSILKLSDGVISQRICEAVETILQEQNDDGTWTLPRNPTRSSIWSLWPFMAALTELLRTPLVKYSTEIVILAPNVVVLQPENAPYSLRQILMRMAILPLTRFVKLYYGWMVMILFVIGGLISLTQGWMGINEFLLSLLFPILLLVLQVSIQPGKKGGKP